MTISKKNKLLGKIYFSPSHKGSFGSIKKLYNEAKKIDPFITLNDTKKFLQSTKTYTSHKQIKKQFNRRKTIVSGLNSQWQLDLIIFKGLKKYNFNYAYVLAVIDCFSRFAYVEPLKYKTAEETLHAFKQILKRAKVKPEIIQSDDGGEFLGCFKKFILQNKIHFFSTSQSTKSSIVERFNKTFQNKIYKYLTSKNTLRYINVLQQICQSYNKTKHKALGISPSEVNIFNSRKIWKKQYGKYLYDSKSKFKFKLNDKVKITKYRKTFQRGYLPNWKSEIFQIAHRLRTVPLTYILLDKDNNLLKGAFYEEELNKVRGT